ncbi:MAG: ABC transporter permease [Candidatus Acetothermia bacterium]|jgi:putative ABC transport system permease protein|nr:ABC transporter permease [Candidatus Acetothermia bacterium]
MIFRVRTVAVLLSVAAGAAALWLSLGLREGVEWNLEDLVQRSGANLFRVEPLLPEGFDGTDLAAIQALDTVTGAAANTADCTSSWSTDEHVFIFTGVTPGYFAIRNLPLQDGRVFEEGETGVAVLGAEVASALYGQAAVGQTLIHRKREFRVIGVLAPVPKDRRRELHEGLDLLVFVPPSEIQKLGFSPDFDTIWVQAKEGELRAAMDEVQVLLGGRGKVTPLISLYDIFFRSQRQIMTSLSVVALLVLIVSALNVTNITSISVLSRTREIGIRRAAGATRGHVRRQFVGEALIMMSTGGLLGGLLAALLAPIVGKLAQVPVRLGYAHLGGIFVLTALGAGAGVVPAIRAGRLSPTKALAHRSLTVPHRWKWSPARMAAGLGVAVGVGTILFIVAFGDCSRSQLERIFGPVDPRVAIIHTETERSPGLARFLRSYVLTQDDCSAVAAIEGVEVAAFIVRNRRTVKTSEGEESIMEFAVPPGAEAIVPGTLREGRFFTREELEHGVPCVVLGAATAERLFPKGSALGQFIRSGDQGLEVIGVFAEGSGTMGEPRFLSGFAYVPAKTLHPAQFLQLQGRIWVKVRTGYDVEAVLAEISDVLAARHPLKAPAAIEGPATELHKLVMMQTNLVRIFLLVAAGALVASVVGVGCMVWYDAAQRTTEVGIRRAVGATRMKILWSFLQGGIGLASGGGVLGLALGAGAATVLALRSGWPLFFSVVWAGWAIGLSVGVGLAGSLWPAWRASRIPPAEAIRRRQG